MYQGPITSWWSRNWKWFLPTLCVLVLLAVLGFVGLVFYGVSSMMKSSDAYQLAVAQARMDPEVVSALGEPIVEGFLASGNINTNGSSGKADLAIPISGPKGGATIYLSATKSVGKWTFKDLVVEVDKSKDRIDLLHDDKTH